MAVAQPAPAVAQKNLADLSPFNGVWDAYGWISCREGDAAPEALTIRDGKVAGKVQTTDNANRIFGKIDRFGQQAAYVNGQYTLMRFDAVINDEKRYGVAHVHRPGRGTAPVSLAAEFRRDDWNWGMQERFEQKFRALTRLAEDKRIKSIVERR